MLKIKCNCQITADKIKEYEEFIVSLEQPLKESKLTDLICVLLQASYEVDENKVFFSEEGIKKFSGDLLAKILNEGWAIVACLEHGVFISNYHHIRAALELVAIYNWVVKNDSKVEKRVQKYFAFGDLFFYQLYLRYYDNDSTNNSIIQKYFAQETIKMLENKIIEWEDLFKPPQNDLLKISSWHYPATIENILSEFPYKDLKMFYEEFSHATHLSKISQYFGMYNNILGLPGGEDINLKELNKSTIIYLQSLKDLLALIKKTIHFESKVRFPIP